jgi:hypothetical protein
LAAIQHKHSPSRTQGRRRSVHASTKPAVIQSTRTKPQTSTRRLRNSKHGSAKKPKKRERVPALLRFTKTKRGKTTVRRYSGRTFYRFEEVKGKLVDFVEVYTAGDYHAIDVRFQDKTALHFIIDPCFILETDYADWKTGNWRPIKRWPLIHSETHRMK